MARSAVANYRNNRRKGGQFSGKDSDFRRGRRGGRRGGFRGRRRRGGRFNNGRRRFNGKRRGGKGNKPGNRFQKAVNEGTLDKQMESYWDKCTNEKDSKWEVDSNSLYFRNG